MSDDPQRRDAPQRDRGNTPARGPGWRVTPPPRGQANRPQQGTPAPRRNQRWIIAALIVGALALNLWVSSQVLKPNARVRIPYSPTFLAQVKENNVTAISSTADSIQGTFKTAVKYPPDENGVQATKYFSTQVPSFANNSELSSLLQSHNVTIDANNPDTGPSFLTSLIFGFGPTLLLVLLFVVLIRRAAGGAGGAGGMMSFGRSRARRV
ncbi:MAG: ATP-dependent metallopeptidase FtsH/Yme1/Tma family protein, partial [Solirubrobacteraceae bacterium]